MEALISSYGGTSSDSDSESVPPPAALTTTNSHDACPLPPPPLSLLNPPNSLGSLGYFNDGQPSRVRSFPHIEGNYALHVYIPVFIPPVAMKGMAIFLKKVASVVSGLHVVDIDIPLNLLCKDDNKLQQAVLGREFHVSLGRTVPIRVHQIDSVVTMLRQKLQQQKGFLIDFSKWEVFVNDDHTRTFISLEVVATGLSERVPLFQIRKQIQAVNEVYKLHNLPEFYKDPRPHISLAWATGEISNSLNNAVEEERRLAVGSIPKCIFTSKFNGIECRVGKKVYSICKFSHE